MPSRFAVLLFPLLSALAFGACSNESEGEPCDPRAGNSGNDDCQSPLVCTTGLTNANGARCCPQDRANAKTPECALSSATFDGESPQPPDASLGGETSSPEASESEAASDGPVESAIEAGSGDAGEAGQGGDASDGATPEAATD
jgi:hypothetical protein